MNARQRMRDLLVKPGIIVAIGVGDAGQAKLVEAAGFPAVYMSGSVVSMSYGMADAGLLTRTEMVDRARSIASVIHVPLIADADDGYGPPLQIMRTIQEFEKAGVAVIQLEDMGTKKQGVLPVSDMVNSIKAAVAARQDPDLVIVARTDAMQPKANMSAAAAGAMENDALERSIAYASAGADVIMVNHITSAQMLRRFCKEVPKPIKITVGRHPFNEPAGVLEEMGVKMVVFTMLLHKQMLMAARKALAEVHSTGYKMHTEEEFAEDEKYRTLLGQDRFKQIQETYGA
jgi:2-methylisocitrate lyase-like PEP mutase family enzyme